MIFIIISLPGQMIWKVLCCIFCVSFAFWMWEPTWYQWGCGGEVLDAAVALKTGCVCFVFCLFVSSETAELHIPLRSVPRCLIAPNLHPDGSVSPPSLRCTNAIKTDTSDNAAPFKLRGFVCMPSGKLKYGIKTCKMNAWLYPFPKKIKYKTNRLSASHGLCSSSRYFVSLSKIF